MLEGVSGTMPAEEREREGSGGETKWGQTEKGPIM